MEIFKIKNYEQDNPGHSFPETISLNQEEVAFIRGTLASFIGLSPEVDNLNLIQSLWQRATTLNELNAEKDSFDLSEVMRAVQVKPCQSVLIDWDQMKTIDRIQFDDLCRCFEYIWYPSTDDIEIFDDTLSWMMFISHSGEIGIAYLKN